MATGKKSDQSPRSKSNRSFQRPGRGRFEGTDEWLGEHAFVGKTNSVKLSYTSDMQRRAIPFAERIQGAINFDVLLNNDFC